MRLVAGVDSSTQSCKVTLRALESGEVVSEGFCKHPPGSEVEPEFWWSALRAAFDQAGGLDGVEALSIAGQQHGMVVLDDHGRVIRPALLWNDTRSSRQAEDLVAEYGPNYFLSNTGSIPVASFTISKLRWLRENEPANAQKVAAVCLPHDWLTWRLMGFGPHSESPRGPDLNALVTDRSDASGTGYFDPVVGDYLLELVESALGHIPVLPRIIGPGSKAGETPSGIAVACGAGDNAAAALGLCADIGDVVVSIGTSGTVFMVSTSPASDTTGEVAGFADCTGNFLPLVCTLNASRVLDKTRELLEATFSEFESLALAAAPGSDGLVLVPYFDGERTPSIPEATGVLTGISSANFTRQNLARSAIEGILCSLVDGLGALTACSSEPRRVLLIGGAAQSRAVQEIAPSFFPYPVEVPEIGEYVALGAAAQAAWLIMGEKPTWQIEAKKLAAQTRNSALFERYLSAVDNFYLEPMGKPLRNVIHS